MALALAGMVASLLSVVAPAQAAPLFDLVMSTSPDRSNPVPLDGRTVSGPLYAFTSPATGTVRVRFFVDDPSGAGTPYRVETKDPYDLGGTATNGTALAFPTASLSDGQHTITAMVDKTAAVGGGTEIIVATVTVSNGAVLSATPASLSVAAVVGSAPVTRSLAIASSAGPRDFTVTSDQPWLTVSPTSGTTPASVVATLTPGSLTTGARTATLTVASAGAVSAVVPVTFTITTPTSTYGMQVSTSSNRTSPVPLDGSAVTGTIYAFLTPTTGVQRVRFYVDDPTASGSPLTTETKAPLDLMGTAPGGAARAFDTSTLSNGQHVVTALVDRTAAAGGGTVTVTATFTVQSGTVGAFTLSPSTVALSGARSGAASSATVSITRSPSAGPFTVTSNVAWLTATPTSGTTPATLTVTATPGSLAAGTYQGVLTITGSGSATTTLPVTYDLADGSFCSPIACDLIKVPTPTALDFRGGEGGIPDSSGVGTGFTTYLRTGTGGGYLPSNLDVEGAQGRLFVQSTIGQVNTTQNAQDNMLGVGFDGGTPTVLEATLATLPTPTGRFEQAGVWFGFSQDNVMRVALSSPAAGSWRIERNIEIAGVTSQVRTGNLSVPPGTTVAVRIVTDPATRTATAFYRLGSTGLFTALGGAAAIPGEFFSFDAAGIDPAIATRSFAGLYASGRTAVPLPVFGFSGFAVSRADEAPPTEGTGSLLFDRTSYPVANPTAMDVGPDGRVYVATITGDIHVLTLGANGTVIADQLVTTLGGRLALGLAVDPLSTPSDVRVWVSHSSPAVNAGEVNSGMVTRLSGPGLATRSDVITGLPRSIANHSVNAVRFGPDGKLYISVGGNTGAGAPNTASTDFGDREEQVLSAAVVVADVRAPGFDGSCANTTDYRGAVPCDVEPWATGLRNTYDIVWHSNGRLYGTDNGLGVVGTYPPTPVAPCFGFGDTRSWTVGGDNPGVQPDELNLIEQGRYYGHPDPARGECVFGNGSYQGVSAPANYTPAIANLGTNKSANGIIEYLSADTFCGVLRDDLLTANYSTGDDITRIELSADGRSALRTSTLIGGFRDPLPLSQTADGRILVGEMAAGTVTVLTPRDTGC